MSCEICLKNKKLKGKKPNCKECSFKFTIPLPENVKVFSMINDYSSMLYSGMGGVEPAGIKLALEAENIPKNEWDVYTQKMLIYLSITMQNSTGD